MKNLINFKKILTTFILLIVLLVLGFFFLNPLLRWGLEKTLTRTFAAESHVKSLKLSFRNTSLKINGVSVADAEDLSRNLFEFKELGGAINVKQLAYKRVIMPELKLLELQLLNPRTNSKQIKKQKAESNLQNIVDQLDLNYDKKAKTSWDEKNMLAPKALAQATSENTALIAGSEKNWKDLDLENRIKNIDWKSVEIEKNEKSATVIAQKLENLKKIQKDFQTIQKDAAQTQKQIQDNSKKIQDNIKKVETAKDQDLKNALSVFQAPKINYKALTNELIGDRIKKYSGNFSNFLAQSQDFAKPKNPTPKKIKKPRGGQNITFGTPGKLPRLWIQKTDLSGIHNKNTPYEIRLEGYIQDITSEPAVLGKPTLIDIKGQFAQAPDSALSIKGILDHTQEKAQDQIDFYLTKVPLKEFKLNDDEKFPVHLKSALANILGTATISGETIQGKISLDLFKMDFDLGTAPTANQESFLSFILKALEKTDKLEVVGKISGAVKKPDIEIETNAEAIISKAIQQRIDEEFKKAKDQIEKEYNAKIAEQKKKLDEQVKAFQDSTQKELDKQKKALKDYEDQIDKQKKELEQKIKGEQKKTQKQINQEKKKAEDQLKKQLGF